MMTYPPFRIDRHLQHFPNCCAELKLQVALLRQVIGEAVRFVFWSAEFPQVALRALCDFGKNLLDQADLTLGRRNVDDGISPNTLR
jgi:hypothetical protein